MVILYIIFIAIILCLLFYKFVFLRDPSRGIPVGNSVVSPADGKIIAAYRLKNGEIDIRKGRFGKIKALVPKNCEDGWLVTIMMTLFDVHVQRAPVEGIVVEIKYAPGKFKNAVYGDKFLNGLENERNEILIDNKILGRLKIIQIAGFVARRIQCFVSKKQKVNKGERVGRILIGSQVCLIMPKSVKLAVRVGDRVRAGETKVGIYEK